MGKITLGPFELFGQMGVFVSSCVMVGFQVSRELYVAGHESDEENGALEAANNKIADIEGALSASEGLRDEVSRLKADLEVVNKRKQDSVSKGEPNLQTTRDNHANMVANSREHFTLERIELNG